MTPAATLRLIAQEFREHPPELAADRMEGKG